MNNELTLTLGRLLYPLACAALLLWLAWALQRLYRSWSGGEIPTGSFYSLALRAGLGSLTLLSGLLYLAGRWAFAVGGLYSLALRSRPSASAPLSWLWCSAGRGAFTVGRLCFLALRSRPSASVSLSWLLRSAGRGVFALGFALLLASPALAQQLPRVTLPGDAGDGDIFAAFTTFAVYGGRVLVLILSFTGICGICWQTITAFVQARDSGDWGRFGMVFVIGAVVLLFLLAMGQFAWTYLDAIEQI